MTTDETTFVQGDATHRIAANEDISAKEGAHHQYHLQPSRLKSAVAISQTPNAPGEEIILLYCTSRFTHPITLPHCPVPPEQSIDDRPATADSTCQICTKGLYK